MSSDVHGQPFGPPSHLAHTLFSNSQNQAQFRIVVVNHFLPGCEGTLRSGDLTLAWRAVVLSKQIDYERRLLRDGELAVEEGRGTVTLPHLQLRKPDTGFTTERCSG